jgi:hypothetical protein
MVEIMPNDYDKRDAFRALVSEKKRKITKKLIKKHDSFQGAFKPKPKKH